MLRLKSTKRHQTNLISSIIVISTVAALVFLTVCLFRQAGLEARFDAVINWLARLDRAVAGLDTHLEILLCIFALYIAKCQLPIPASVLCVISGMVFPLHYALIINIVFSLFLFYVKYREGRWIGGGWAMMILNIRQIRFIKEWVEFKGTGNPYILVVSRLFPSIPINMISKLYGSMEYDLVYYMCLSIIGYFPRMFIYTKIGTELYNPFSRQFIILLMIIVAFTGITSLIFNVFYGIRSRQMTQTLLIYSQKEKYRIVL